MDENQINILKFRRQFVLAPKSIECPFLHQNKQVSDQYILYSHIDLVVTEYIHKNAKLILLGDMFDYENPSKNNSEILKDLFDDNFENVLSKSAKYTGRFVILFVKGNDILIFNDVSAARKAYYCNIGNDLWIASQPHLLAKILNLKGTTQVSKLSYYQSEDFTRSFGTNIGNTTFYDEVFQLLCNHYLNVNDRKINRYWPVEPNEINSLEFAKEKIAAMIQGIMEAIISRYEVMLPLTAGKDSRTLLSAIQNFRNKVYFYINWESEFKANNPDLLVPKRLLSKLKLDFHVIDPYIPIDKDFERIYFENNPLASKTFLPLIYNYYVNFGNKVNLPGNTASAGLEYYSYFRNKHTTLEDILNLGQLKKYDFVNEYYTKWFSECEPLCSQNNINIISLFYWENRLTNSLLQVQLDKDIAQEEINPFNSRKLVSLFLSVKNKYLLPPDYILHTSIMRLLWPDVLKISVNPSFRNTVLRILNRMRLLDVIYRIKFKLKN
jgi:hypothetical protein